MGTQHRAQSRASRSDPWPYVWAHARAHGQHTHAAFLQNSRSQTLFPEACSSEAGKQKQRQACEKQRRTLQHDCYDANFRLQPLTELESERNESNRDSMRDSKRRELEREYSLYFFMREDWEPARSRETMTTRQPTLATNPVFSQSEPDRQLSKG